MPNTIVIRDGSRSKTTLRAAVQVTTSHITSCYYNTDSEERRRVIVETCYGLLGRVIPLERVVPLGRVILWPQQRRHLASARRGNKPPPDEGTIEIVLVAAGSIAGLFLFSVDRSSWAAVGR